MIVMKIIEEKVCINCNYFFPYFVNGPTEEGICLNDPEFEPYIDELLDKQNYNICLSLIEKKKFNGNDNTCEKFEMSVIIDEDEDEDEDETENEAISAEVLVKLLKNKSIEEYRINLKNENKNKQIEALNSLYVLTVCGNKEAEKLMNKYFKSLPSPKSLEEVHHKVKVLRIISKNEINSGIVKALVKDLLETISNQTTRQWFTEVFRVLYSNRNNEMVKQSLQKMPLEKFSYRLQKKIKDILYDNDYNYF